MGDHGREKLPWQRNGEEVGRGNREERSSEEMECISKIGESLAPKEVPNYWARDSKVSRDSSTEIKNGNSQNVLKFEGEQTSSNRPSCYIDSESHVELNGEERGRDYGRMDYYDNGDYYNNRRNYQNSRREYSYNNRRDYQDGRNDYYDGRNDYYDGRRGYDNNSYNDRYRRYDSFSYGGRNGEDRYPPRNSEIYYRNRTGYPDRYVCYYDREHYSTGRYRSEKEYRYLEGNGSKYERDRRPRDEKYNREEEYNSRSESCKDNGKSPEMENETKLDKNERLNENMRLDDGKESAKKLKRKEKKRKAGVWVTYNSLIFIKLKNDELKAGNHETGKEEQNSKEIDNVSQMKEAGTVKTLDDKDNQQSCSTDSIIRISIMPNNRNSSRQNEAEKNIENVSTTLLLLGLSPYVNAKEIDDILRRHLPNVGEFNIKIVSGDRNDAHINSYRKHCFLNFSCIEDAVNVRKIFLNEVIYGYFIRVKYFHKW